MHADRLQDMTEHYHADTKFGRWLLASLILHLVMVLILAGGWFGSSRHESKPIYYVDLVHKPVLNPQAGRPEPRPKAKAKPTPVKRQAVSDPPKPTVPAKPKVKLPAKVTPAAVKPKPAKRQEIDLQQKLAAMREKENRQSEIDALKSRLTSLRDAPAATIPADVPVGMPTGTGTEVGVSTLAYIQATIQQNWALSPYLLDQSRLASIEARIQLEYSAAGTLVRYRILESSGNSQFDESIKQAIIKSKQLTQKLPRNEEFTVIFNLKEMVAARR